MDVLGFVVMSVVLFFRERYRFLFVMCIWETREFCSWVWVFCFSFGNECDRFIYFSLIC